MALAGVKNTLRGCMFLEDQATKFDMTQMLICTTYLLQAPEVYQKFQVVAASMSSSAHLRSLRIMTNPMRRVTHSMTRLAIILHESFLWMQRLCLRCCLASGVEVDGSSKAPAAAVDQ